jgi:N6-adenosine-specific RNA methylase IME4
MKYQTILIDPPWKERGSGRIKRGADRHYPLLSTPKILETIYLSGAFAPASSCHLYLWVTNNFLKDGLWLMDQLGFTYVTMRTWAKEKIGLGRYFRGKTEHTLFGTLGDYQDPGTRTISTLIGNGIVSKRGHSKKPEQQYAEIMAVSPGPYLEMFATEPRPGWSSWGRSMDRRSPRSWCTPSSGERRRSSYVFRCD